ncbi:hypothetical protein E2C01_008718 [Portunus trituberculatus]|uniref:Uncharacterized protein n=1 Tax=Portunus trituberculatus TaxID=210409 RepID=A0A5B7D5K8_PORTR|nr:hypothetical protein [Portunus trituberculatus]
MTSLAMMDCSIPPQGWERGKARRQSQHEHREAAAGWPLPSQTSALPDVDAGQMVRHETAEEQPLTCWLTGSAGSSRQLITTAVWRLSARCPKLVPHPHQGTLLTTEALQNNTTSFHVHVLGEKGSQQVTGSVGVSLKMCTLGGIRIRPDVASF